MLEKITGLIPFRVAKDKIHEMRDYPGRGNIVQRVTPNGKIINPEILVITGSFVSGYADDPDSIKKVYARLLVEKNGKLILPEGSARFEYDPKLTVVKLGHIDDYTKPGQDFFEVLDEKTGFF